MLASIWGAITTFITFLGFAMELWNTMKKANRENWMQEGKNAIKKAKNAKTDAERLDAAKAISSWITGMPS